MVDSRSKGKTVTGGFENLARSIEAIGQKLDGLRFIRLERKLDQFTDLRL